jgi:hypothetical protein
MVVYTFVSIGLMATHSVGLTSEHVILIGIVAFAVVGRARPFVWDWLPFLFVAVMFEDLTSVGAALATSVHSLGPIALERSLLGGAVATTWLQAHVGSSHLVPVLNAVLTGEYLFHFAAPLAAGLWLWLRHREHFGRFVSAYMLLMTTGFVIYLLFPEMPPWLAARDGLLPPVHRIVVESLQQLAGFGQFYSGADPEPNAAMPSLHVAVPMLIAATVMGVSKRRRIAGLWMLYPLTISFGVVYLGEHYVADAVVGLALGLACYGAVEIGGAAAASSAIRRRISSRSRRIVARSRPAGSSSSQSRYRLPGIYGQASPHPMVTTTSAHPASPSSSRLGVRPAMSMPTSAMASTTTGFTSPAGSDPADRA